MITANRGNLGAVKPTILILSDYYSPGYRAGGVPRAVENLIERLSEHFLFKVVTRDRDIGSRASYESLTSNEWSQVGQAMVMYLSPDRLGLNSLRRVIDQTPHDVLYLHSVFSWPFAISPLVLRRVGAIRPPSVLVAPHGELGSGARRHKRIRKHLYIALSRVLGLYNEVRWHASTVLEEEQIRSSIERRTQIDVACDLPTRLRDSQVEPVVRTKTPGSLSVVFLSRVDRKKNLHVLIDIVRELSGKVDLHVYGPHADARYWSECEQAMRRLPANIAVHDHGPIPPRDVPRALRSHHVFALPTHDENYGYVVLEALAAGCPVLLSDQTPWRNLQELGVGWDLPLRKRSEFRAVLQRCVNMDVEEFGRMSSRASAYAAVLTTNESAANNSRSMLEEAVRKGVRQTVIDGAVGRDLR